MKAKTTQPTYDQAQSNDLTARFFLESLECDHVRRCHYRYMEDAKPMGEIVYSRGSGEEDDKLDYVCRGDDWVMSLIVEDGQIWIGVAAMTAEGAEAKLEEAKEKMPKSELPDDKTVPVTFWAYGPRGPFQVNRDLQAPKWQQTQDNYPSNAGDELRRLFEEDFTPGLGGQLLLWHGPAGTGKTTALRVLAQEWKDWAELHYITDPEKFFGTNADYMLHVMLQAGSATPYEIMDDEKSKKDKWRVLVLEDCGQLLAATAREETGTALGRFLNSVDGLIGQGLRILVLATTNEKVENWHEAVIRPGRAASIIHFDKLSTDEVAEWWEKHGPDDTTPPHRECALADLYAEIAGTKPSDPNEKKNKAVGFAAA